MSGKYVTMFGRPLSRKMSNGGLGGFTLIELLVAVAILAILAGLCWRGLDTILKTRDRLTDAGDELRSLSITFSQMDEDLRRSWPMRLLAPGVPVIRFTPSGGNLQLELLREGGSALDAVRPELVAYRIRDAQFERGYAAYVRGASSGATSWIWQPLLATTQATTWRVWVQGRGWVPGEALLTTSASAPNAAVVLGVEIKLTRQSGDTYTRVFSIRD